jgi:dUTP pyrophosphatase
VNSLKIIVKSLASSYENNTYIQLVKLIERALTPTRESPESAGFEMHSPYDTTVPARGKELIATDLQIKLPEGCYSRIAARTDLAL